MGEHLYRLQYKMEPHPEGITKAQAIEANEQRGMGSCDAMLLASIIFPEDGSYSCLFVSKDGRTGEDLSDLEWFKVWSMLSHRLARSTTLDEGRRSFCEAVFETFREAHMAGRGQSEAPDPAA